MVVQSDGGCGKFAFMDMFQLRRYRWRLLSRGIILHRCTSDRSTRNPPNKKSKTKIQNKTIPSLRDSRRPASFVLWVSWMSWVVRLGRSAGLRTILMLGLSAGYNLCIGVELHRFSYSQIFSDVL